MFRISKWKKEIDDKIGIKNSMYNFNFKQSNYDFKEIRNQRRINVNKNSPYQNATNMNMAKVHIWWIWHDPDSRERKKRCPTICHPYSLTSPQNTKDLWPKIADFPWKNNTRTSFCAHSSHDDAPSSLVVRTNENFRKKNEYRNSVLALIAFFELNTA